MVSKRLVGRIAVATMAGLVWLAAQAADGKDSLPLRPKPQPRLGMNLSGPADWNTELPFADVFRLSRPWISQRQGEAWGKGPALALDEHGWVKRLDPDCWAETPLCTIQGGHYPSGEYTVLYDGHGKLDVWGAATAVSREPRQMTIKVDASKGGFFLKLAATNPENYVRNIRVVMPGFEKTFRENPFHPAFLRHWQGGACLRFMDWMHTNGSKISRWSERPTPEDATFSAKGVALEVMIDLANRLKADPWFCMPHLADDDYVREFAKLVKERLDPNIRVYEQKKVADKFGLKLVAYEGGQHMVGVLGGENNEAMTRLFHAANRHPRMGEVYRKYYDAWTAEGGDLFCYFASTGAWSKWGSWGILEWFDEDPTKSPKFMATMRWARQCGQKVNLPR